VIDDRGINKGLCANFVASPAIADLILALNGVLGDLQ
jgi:hypothetical protein